MFEGIPVISMVSLAASYVHMMRTYGADGVFLVEILCILLHKFDEVFFSQIIQDRQSNQRISSLNKICSHLILLMLIFFPLSNCLTRTVFFLSSNHFYMTKYQSKGA